MEEARKRIEELIGKATKEQLIALLKLAEKIIVG